MITNQMQNVENFQLAGGNQAGYFTKSGSIESSAT